MGLTDMAVTYSYQARAPRKRRGRWELAIEQCGSDGSRRCLTRMTDIRCDESTRGSRIAKRLTQEWLDELKEAELQSQHEHERASLISGIADDQRDRLCLPLEDYGKLFLERRIRLHELEASTADHWMEDFTRYCVKALPQGIRVIDLTEDDVVSMIDEIINGRGLSTYSARRGFLALRQVMTYAVDYDGLKNNPCSRIKTPKNGLPRQNPLSVHNASQLIATLKSMAMTKTVFAACLALLTGISEGEICGLSLNRVDLGPKPSFLVKECVGKTSHGFYLKVPKNPSRVRRVQMTPTVRELFDRRVEALRQECKEAGTSFSSDLFVIGSPTGAYMQTTALSKGWTQLSRAFGLRGLEGLSVTYHDLRHTFATCASASGMDIATIAKIMGHSSTYVTQLVYISADPDEQVSSLEKLESKLGA